jgi:regulator of nucleoside diphosphate kinase
MIGSARPLGSNDNWDRPYLQSLAAELDRATVIESSAVPPDVVTMNSRVRLRDRTNSWTVTLVFPQDADPEDDRISVLAPLGAALLGCRCGCSFSFRVPSGDVRSCDVLNILYQPEAAGDLDL